MGLISALHAIQKKHVCVRVHTCLYVIMSIISVIMEVMMEGGLKMMIK